MVLGEVSKHVQYLRKQGCKIRFDIPEQDFDTVQTEVKLLRRLDEVQERLKQTQVKLARYAGQQPKGAGRPKKKLPFATRQAITVEDKLTPNEEKILTVALKRSHKEGTTPLLDFMAEQGLSSKPSMTQAILSYYREYPGHTVRQCADVLGKKFAVHYDGSVKEAIRCFIGLINVMCLANSPQKALQKVGGSPGIGHGGKVFLLDDLQETG
jgi:hypothetical protein